MVSRSDHAGCWVRCRLDTKQGNVATAVAFDGNKVTGVSLSLKIASSTFGMSESKSLQQLQAGARRGFLVPAENVDSHAENNIGRCSSYRSRFAD